MACVAVLASGVVVSSAEARVLGKSTFNTDAEGWKVVGDTVAGKEIPDHVATGGDPGGYVTIQDDVLGGTMYWRAPKTIRKQAADALGGSLSFSLRQTSAIARPYDADDVILEGGGVTLVYLTDVNAPLAPIWGKYNVPLSNAGWTNAATSGPATRRDMKKALKSLDVLTIRAEYEAGEDTDDLDSVILRSAKRKRGAKRDAHATSRRGAQARFASAIVCTIAVAATLAMLFASRSEAAWSGASEVSDATTRGASDLATDANPLGDLVLGWSYGVNDVAAVVDPAGVGAGTPQPLVGDYGAPTIGVGGNGVGAIAFPSILASPSEGIFAASKDTGASSFGAVAQIQGPNSESATGKPILAVNGSGTGQLFHDIGNQQSCCTHGMLGRVLTNPTTNVWTAGNSVSSYQSETYDKAIATATDGSAVVLFKTNNGSGFRSIEPVVIENGGTVAKGSSIASSSGGGSGVLTNPSAFDLDRMPDAAVVAVFVRSSGTGGGIFVVDFAKARASGTGSIPAEKVSADSDGSQSEVATDDAGNTLVTWYDPSDGAGDPNALRSVFRPTGSSVWGPIQTIATENFTSNDTGSDMEMDAVGNAYVVYEAGDVIKAASRRPGAAAGWSAPVTLSTAQTAVENPTVAAGRNYEAFASWIGTGTDNVYLATADITPVACEDGVDNDSDSAIDFPADPGCSSLTDNDETDPAPDPGPTTPVVTAPDDQPPVLAPPGPGVSDDRAACKNAQDKLVEAKKKLKKLKKRDADPKAIKKARKKVKKAKDAVAQTCG